ncbi:MAG: LysR substrate-binding domain-containing protein, partial [Leptolyngbyaceae cyanobacterium bins.59]|nr:LysR substrate-binding domain-containing protein [Leptolyngbyaceae cyanobacterium bins.59]
FDRHKITVEDLLTTTWVMREQGSGAQQMFEKALQSWSVDLAQLEVVLVLNSSEMVKAVVEGGIGAAALPELMVQKELRLGVLNAVQVIDQRSGTPALLDIVQPIWKLKHRQRFQTQIMVAFENILHNSIAIAS